MTACPMSGPSHRPSLRPTRSRRGVDARSWRTLRPGAQHDRGVVRLLAQVLAGHPRRCLVLKSLRPVPGQRRARGATASSHVKAFRVFSAGAAPRVPRLRPWNLSVPRLWHPMNGQSGYGCDPCQHDGTAGETWAVLGGSRPDRQTAVGCSLLSGPRMRKTLVCYLVASYAST